MVGSLYLVKIYFTDLSAYKIRPVLIIKEMGSDYGCLQISSQIKNNRIVITQNDIVDGNLKKVSVIVLPKNFTLHNTVLSKYIAKINKDLFDRIFKQFCTELVCNKI